jgi:hypothetical protein
MRSEGTRGSEEGVSGSVKDQPQDSKCAPLERMPSPRLL